MVEQTIDLEQLDHHKFVIKSEYDEALQRLEEELKEVGYDPVRLMPKLTVPKDKRQA